MGLSFRWGTDEGRTPARKSSNPTAAHRGGGLQATRAAQYTRLLLKHVVDDMEPGTRVRVRAIVDASVFGVLTGTIERPDPLRPDCYRAPLDTPEVAAARAASWAHRRRAPRRFA